MYFTDSKGLEWDLSLTVGTVTNLSKFYRCEADVVLQEKVTEVMIRGSYIDLCTMFWGLLKDQAKVHGVSQEQFMNFSPDEWEQLAASLEEAIVAFTRPGQRAALEATVTKVREMEAKVTTKAIETLNDPDLEEMMLDQVADKMKAAMSQKV